MTSTSTTPIPLLARVLIAGAGIMSLANSVTIPFLAVFLHRGLGLAPGLIGFVIGPSVFFSIFAGFVGGSLSDSLGRTRLLVFSLLGVIGSFRNGGPPAAACSSGRARGAGRRLCAGPSRVV
jgi:MFS family permease